MLRSSVLPAVFALAYALLNLAISVTLSGPVTTCPEVVGQKPWRRCLRNVAAALRDPYHTVSMGHLRFVKLVSVVEAVGMGLLMGLLRAHKGQAWQVCNWTCLCWWINPKYQATVDSPDWYVFSAGLVFNTVVNAFIGDALVTGLLLPYAVRWYNRRAASKEPTQRLMDERCRSRDDFYLPWRVVHMVKAWIWCAFLRCARGTSSFPRSASLPTFVAGRSSSWLRCPSPHFHSSGTLPSPMWSTAPTCSRSSSPHRPRAAW